MTRTGNTVDVERVMGYEATFIGTLSADKNHLSGSWTMGKAWFWTAPMHIDLTRTFRAVSLPRNCLISEAIPPQTSRFVTESAFFSMNSRRGST